MEHSHEKPTGRSFGASVQVINCAALLIIAFAVYFNSLHGQFMMDDYGILLEDPKKHSLNMLGLHFIPDADTQIKNEPVQGDLSYRPLAHILLSLLYLSFGKNPLGC